MKSTEKIIRRVSAGLYVVSCAALTFLMLLVTLNVVLRTVFKMPILGTYDLTGFLTVIVIGCGLAFCSLEDGHIEISFFVDKMGPKTRRWVTSTGRLISFALLAVYSYSLFNMAARLMRANEVSVTTKTPLHYFVYLTAFCFTIFSLTVFLKLFDRHVEGEKNDT